MFDVGNAIIYGSTGVCLIEDIRTEDFLGKREPYYILKPFFSKGSTIFCPVSNSKVTMRHVSERDELDRSIRATDTDVPWIAGDQQRREFFSAVLKRCEVREMGNVISLLCRKKAEKEAVGKRLHVSDEKALADIQELLFGEIAYVFGIDIENAAALFYKLAKGTTTDM